MLLEEYSLEHTKVKFYDDCIVQNITFPKEYIDKIFINLINKSFHCNMNNIERR